MIAEKTFGELIASMRNEFDVLQRNVDSLRKQRGTNTITGAMLLQLRGPSTRPRPLEEQQNEL